MEIQIELSAPLLERLLLCAAEEETSAEEIIERAIRKYMKRGDDNAERGEERYYGQSGRRASC